MRDSKGRFVKGNHTTGEFKKGNIISEETKRKMRDNHKGMKGKKQSEETKKKIGKANGGKKHWNWNGGKAINSNGYVLILRHNHPFSTKRGYVLRSRLAAEKELRRFLSKFETIHHRNGKRDDDRWDNLFVFENQAEHQKYERFLRRTL